MYIERNQEENLVLFKKDENNSIININNGAIIQYKGIYYKKKENDSINTLEIETFFVGKIDEYKYNHENGYEGIFVQPLFILNELTQEWKRITNYSPPTHDNKYFYYPHLLMLPPFHSYHNPLYFLHTCKNVNLDDFKDIALTFEL